MKQLIRSLCRYFRERKCTTCRVKPGTKRIVTLLTMTIIWIVPFLIAIYPIFDPGLPYTITALGVIIAPNVSILICKVIEIC